MFYTVVVCEKCGRGETIAYAAGITCVRNLARKRGWSVGRKKGKLLDYTLCPNCRRGAKKNAE